ncbi:hypothetical protein CASFOL_011891 [Castilleja foliolosa]|uniref:Uncharacterized protein n=1 Tax=Castilleja foliolosa TaxID=1961234 RepID=A0ABD3DSW7_9LAMI
MLDTLSRITCSSNPIQSNFATNSEELVSTDMSHALHSNYMGLGLKTENDDCQQRKIGSVEVAVSSYSDLILEGNNPTIKNFKTNYPQTKS